MARAFTFLFHSQLLCLKCHLPLVLGMSASNHREGVPAVVSWKWGHHLGGEQFDGPHHLLVGQSGETEVSEDMVYTRLLRLLNALDDHLGSAAQGRKTGVA